MVVVLFLLLVSCLALVYDYWRDCEHANAMLP